MAEETDSKETQEVEHTKAKRHLRTGSETVRERTEKFQTKQRLDAEPSRRNVFFAFLSGFAWPLRKLGHFLSKLGRFRVFRILGRIIVPGYFRNSWRELRLVTWPDRRTSFRLTYAVIVFSVLFGVIIAIVDFGLDKLFKEFIIK